jgi:hypothetical protein
MVQTIVRSDRANEDMRFSGAVNNLVRLTENTKKPLSETQASNWVYKTMRKDPRLKGRLVVAQKTTSKRSMSSVAQQWRWYRNIQEALNLLRQKNTGVCRKTGKQFGEVMDFLVVGADEACLMSDTHGNFKIIRLADKKKHERKSGDKVWCQQWW